MTQQHIGFDSYDSMEGIAAIEPTGPPDRFASWPQAKLVHAVYPGVLVSGTIALASTWLGQHYTAPVMLFALLFGMAFHFLHEEGRCIAGIEFTSRSVLRTGVALLGMRITLGQIVSLGVVPVLTVIAAVATTIAFGVFMSRRLGLTSMFGILSGGSVAICGASAALAIASVLPRDEHVERDTILTVVTVTALSTLAMILYPILATSLGLDHQHAGVFIGGTIHDVAQVVGAGYIISPETGDIATYVKLLRVAMLLPSVFVISMLVSRNGGAAGARAEISRLSHRIRGFGARQFTRRHPASPERFRERRFALVPRRGDRRARHENLFQGAFRRRPASAGSDGRRDHLDPSARVAVSRDDRLRTPPRPSNASAAGTLSSGGRCDA